MTPLGTKLIRQIRQNGPMSVADYMAQCLLDPTDGYYATRDPFGAEGDFTTAPEISQMFGEMIGLALAQAWLDQGRPAQICLAEIGPGRGTLMADILRATRSVPGFHSAAKIHLIEASQHLRKVQALTLADIAPIWLDSATDLPKGVPLFVIANELFDALPIRQFQRSGTGWCERLIAEENDALHFGLSPSTPYGLLAPRLGDTRDADIVETCPAAGPIMAECASRIGASGGAGLMIDYGGWRSRGDTLQALSAHTFVDPLEKPGDADLTAHVDFEVLDHAAKTASDAIRTSALTPQGVFLERLGITARAQSLARNLSGNALNQHIAAHRRLTHPDEMGTLFKVLGLAPSAAPELPGLSG